MDYDKNICPIVDVEGVIENGKQFDIEINLPEDNRNVIFGVVKDCYKEPVQNAVVKLIEIVCEKGREEKRPVSHTFTDCDGEFVFGPLCHNKMYEIQLWVDNVKHVKICAKCDHRDEDCLKGIDMDSCKDLRPICCDKCHDKCDKDEWNKCDNKCDKDKCDNKCDNKCDDKCHKDKY